jgi:NAD(P)H-flavin reductase
MTSPWVVTPSAGRPPPRGELCSHRQLQITAIIRESTDVRTYFLSAAENLPRSFAPGQFNMLLLPGFGEAAISISSDPATPEIIGHTVRALGSLTGALAGLAPGDPVFVRGPYGIPWPVPLDDHPPLTADLLLVAGGVGIASLRAAIHAVLSRRGRYRRIVVACGAKTPTELLYRHEHAAWQAGGIEVRLIVDKPLPGWTGPVGVVPELLPGLKLDPASTTVLCCGPEPTMRAVRQALIAHGIGLDQIFLALERRMSCGIGLCGLCQLGPFFLCRDGPVFRADTVLSFLDTPAV